VSQTQARSNSCWLSARPVLGPGDRSITALRLITPIESETETESVSVPFTWMLGSALMTPLPTSIANFITMPVGR
jgi:hypothetical protein